MTTTPTSGAADLPEALRSIQRFEVVDCIDDKHVPAVIPKPHGPWVRYEDHIAALAAGQATTAQQPGAAYAALPESLILAVDRWFADNTGLGGCSGKDVRELAELFYDVTHEGGRESVDDALAIVESFGPGIGGLNDTYARQILLAEEVKRLRASHGQAPAQPVVPAFTEAQIASACLSYRHDFGLLGETDRKSMMWIARQWERAFAKEREFAAPAQPAPYEIINMAREQGLPETETEGVFRVNVDDLGRIFASYRAARATADSVLEDAARESEYRRGYRHGYEQRDAEVRGALA